MENIDKIDNKNLDRETIIDNLKRGNSKHIKYPSINPFDENGELEDIDFPEGEVYPFIYSNLSKSEIPDYLRTLRSKSIIEYAENLQKLKNIEINEENIIHEESINESNSDNKITEVSQQEDYIGKSRTYTSMTDFFKNVNNNNFLLLLLLLLLLILIILLQLRIIGQILHFFRINGKRKYLL